MSMQPMLHVDQNICYRNMLDQNIFSKITNVQAFLKKYSATGLESRKLFSFAKTIHLMFISILPSLDAVPYI